MSKNSTKHSFMKVQLRGIIYLLISPFAPRATFKSMEKDEGRDQLYFFALTAAIVSATIIVMLQKPRFYFGNNVFFYYLGFCLGIILRCFIMGALIRLLSFRLLHYKPTLYSTVNIYIVTLFPFILTLPFTIYFPSYRAIYYLIFLRTFVILTIGIWRITKGTLGKSILISFSCTMLYFFVRMAFFGMSI